MAGAHYIDCVWDWRGGRIGRSLGPVTTYVFLLRMESPGTPKSDPSLLDLSTGVKKRDLAGNNGANKQR